MTTTQSENRTFRGRRSGTSGTAETPLPGRYAAAGRYTDTDTLLRGNDRRVVHPGSYTDADSLTRARTDIVRAGSYTDVGVPLAAVSRLGRAGRYTDTDLNTDTDLSAA